MVSKEDAVCAVHNLQDEYDSQLDKDASLLVAIECIEKQIQKKVICHFGGYVYCPRCKHDYSHLEDPIDYCYECGQHLDWDDD